MSNKSGRVFGASLKPAWSVDKINEFLDKTKGDILVFIINHDKDINDNGELIEKHTHIYLEYSSPRKVSTISNLLEVESNFIEVVRNKKGYLRYLTHKDETEKHIYDDSEVFTNSDIPYKDIILGNSLTDKQIAEYLVQGRGMELLGIVSASKLRTIQSFLHFDNNNLLIKEIKRLNQKVDSIVEFVDKAEKVALSFSDGLKHSVEDLSNGMKLIANEISKARVIATTRKKN